jgi:hypothetical protein
MQRTDGGAGRFAFLRRVPGAESFGRQATQPTPLFSSTARPPFSLQDGGAGHLSVAHCCGWRREFHPRDKGCPAPYSKPSTAPRSSRCSVSARDVPMCKEASYGGLQKVGAGPP